MAMEEVLVTDYSDNCEVTGSQHELYGGVRTRLGWGTGKAGVGAVYI